MRILLGLWIGAIVAAGQMPDIFIVPGERLGSQPEVAVYAADPFARVGTVPTQPYVTIFLAHPDGTRFYSISRLGPDGLRVISAAAPYAELKRLPVVDTVAAAISPDGRRLVLIGSNNITGANTVTILDLQTDTVAAQLSIPHNVRDQVAFAADSSRAFFLTISPGLLYAVDLTTNTLAPNPLSMPVAEVVRVGPNGLVYVAAGKYLLEVDGETLTPWDTILVSPQGRTTALELSRDGEYAITNRSLVNLRTRRVTPTPLSMWDAIRMTEVGSNRLFVNGSELKWSGGPEETISLAPLPVSGLWEPVTNEFPAARYHVERSGVDTLRRYSLDRLTAPAEALPGAPGDRILYQPRPGSGAPVRLVGFQAEQTVRTSDNPKPIVARVLNAGGKPLANVAVVFESTIRSAIVNTDFNGYAMFRLSPGLAPAQYAVRASVAGLQAVSYNVIVEADPVGPVQLVAMSGMGQYQNGRHAYESIVVQLRDSLGKPRPREAVKFRLRSGLGALGPVTTATCVSGECTVLTDADGYAAIDFVPHSEQYDRSSPVAETIVASAGGATVEVIRTIVPRIGSFHVELVSPASTAIGGIAGELVPNGFRARIYFGQSEGNRIPMASIRVSMQGLVQGGATPFTCEVLSDSDGYVSCELRFPAPAGVWRALILVGGTTFDHWRETLILTSYPNVPQVALSPASTAETGADRTFEIAAFRPGVEAPFGILNLLINSALDGRRACYIAYSIAEERLYLVDDEGPESGLSAPLALGGSGSVSNGQCTVLGTGSSFSGTSSRPVLRLRIRFAAGFSGPRLVQIASRTRNDAESSGWQTADVITLPSSNLATGPQVAPLNPSTRASSFEQVDFEFTDASGGSANLLTVWGLIGPSLNAGTGCVFAYYAPGNLIALYPDNGIPTGVMVPFRFGEVLENSRCRLEPVERQRTASGLRLRIRIGAKPPFEGSKTIWGAASTLQNAVSPWTPIAAWRVRGPYN